MCTVIDCMIVCKNSVSVWVSFHMEYSPAFITVHIWQKQQQQQNRHNKTSDNQRNHPKGSWKWNGIAYLWHISTIHINSICIRNQMGCIPLLQHRVLYACIVFTTNNFALYTHFWEWHCGLFVRWKFNSQIRQFRIWIVCSKSCQLREKPISFILI